MTVPPGGNPADGILKRAATVCIFLIPSYPGNTRRLDVTVPPGGNPAGWAQPKGVVELQRQGWHHRHSSRELSKRQVC